MDDLFYHNLNRKIKTIKDILYNLGIDTLALLKKMALFVSLPIKFIQFWKEAWNYNNQSKTYDEQNYKDEDRRNSIE